MPQRQSFSTRKASQVRKQEPMLCMLRTLSRITQSGYLSASLNWAVLIRPSSCMVLSLCWVIVVVFVAYRGIASKVASFFDGFCVYAALWMPVRDSLPAKIRNL